MYKSESKNSFMQEVLKLLTNQDIERWAYAIGWICIGFPLAKLASIIVFRIVSKTGRTEIAMLAKRATFLSIGILVTFSSLKELGIDLSVMLGAAGILTVAIGFASQTSASNVISGLFLIGERPFVTGDIIQIGNTTGRVLSIDMVSIKLRTYDNLLVRIPNESLFKSEIWNLTHFPVRRFTFYLYFSYDQDLDKARHILKEVAVENSYVLDEPEPLITVDSFLENSIKIQYSVWGLHNELSEVKGSIHEDLKRKFDQCGILYGMPRSQINIVHERSATTDNDLPQFLQKSDAQHASDKHHSKITSPNEPILHLNLTQQKNETQDPEPFELSKTD